MKVLIAVVLLLVLLVSVYQLFTRSVKDSPQYRRQVILNARIATLQVAKRSLDGALELTLTIRFTPEHWRVYFSP
jgi:hypothetical protein